jgi:hypothetical protein
MTMFSRNRARCKWLILNKNIYRIFVRLSDLLSAINSGMASSVAADRFALAVLA